ncbi:MAG TPA: acetyl-CoA carboxylase biotin carboxyl carrier protein subunit [Cytophagaceae bacterium]|jgi:biotin carboxyl carrier protein
MLQIKVGKGKNVECRLENDNYYVNDKLVRWDLISVGNNNYHILLNNKSYAAEVLSADYVNKLFKLKINNQIVEVKAKDKFDLLLEKMGLSKEVSVGNLLIKAPMPGLILDVLTSEGDEVASGQSVIVLEAMKMENIIKSPITGVVKAVKVKNGDKVEKGQLLVELKN